ncbi:hypothetical protein ACOJBO_43960 [Rhizobium beringeri]
MAHGNAGASAPAKGCLVGCGLGDSLFERLSTLGPHRQPVAGRAERPRPRQQAFGGRIGMDDGHQFVHQQHADRQALDHRGIGRCCDRLQLQLLGDGDGAAQMRCEQTQQAKLAFAHRAGRSVAPERQAGDHMRVALQPDRHSIDIALRREPTAVIGIGLQPAAIGDLRLQDGFFQRVLLDPRVAAPDIHDIGPVARQLFHPRPLDPDTDAEDGVAFGKGADAEQAIGKIELAQQLADEGLPFDRFENAVIDHADELRGQLKRRMNIHGKGLHR